MEAPGSFYISIRNYPSLIYTIQGKKGCGAQEGGDRPKGAGNTRLPSTGTGDSASQLITKSEVTGQPRKFPVSPLSCTSTQKRHSWCLCFTSGREKSLPLFLVNRHLS